MNEDEAKTKWCPARRQTLDAFCIGTRCMAWRWNGHVDRATGRLLQGLTDIERNESDDHVAAVGFCGLSGKP